MIKRLLPLLIIGLSACSQEAPPPEKPNVDSFEWPSPTPAKSAGRIAIQLRGMEVEPKFVDIDEEILLALPPESAVERVYTELRDAAIQEFLAQEYDAQTVTWDRATVREKFKREWPMLQLRLSAQQTELKLQREHLLSYLAENEKERVSPAEYFKRKFSSNEGENPFGKEADFHAFVRLHRNTSDLDRQIEKIPTTEEAAWNTYRLALEAEAFSDEWVMDQLRVNDPSIDQKFSDSNILKSMNLAVGDELPSTEESWVVQMIQARKREVLTATRNVLCISRLVKDIKVRPQEWEEPFKLRLRAELEKPLPILIGEGNRAALLTD